MPSEPPEQDSPGFTASKRIQPQLDAMKQAWIAIGHLSIDEMETVVDFLSRQVCACKKAEFNRT